MVKRKLLAVACLLICGVAFSSRADDPVPNAPSSFRIAGYLPDYRTFDLVQAEFLTDVIIFSAQPTEQGEIDMSRLNRVAWSQLLDAKRTHKLRLILCIGGWERSTHFAKVAASEQLRATFVTSARKICLERQLDGIDIDWEHPRDAQEQNSYADLLQDLQRELGPADLSVSLTMAAWQTVPRQAFEAVDWVQVMAYDHPGRHSTFENAQADINKMVQAGVPEHKITLGLPFYGRSIQQADRSLTYREIVQQYQPAPAVDEVAGIYFNGPATIRRKTQLARDSKLAGVMIWELGQDSPAPTSLLQAIRTIIEP